MKRNVVALFERYDQAERAVDRMVELGVDRNDVSIMAADSKSAVALEQENPEANKVKRAGAGAVVGGVAGAVLGLTALAIPGLGPILAAGPIAGALSGGLLGGFLGLGIDHDAAQYYAHGVEEGGAVVAIAADPDRADEIEAELDRAEGAQARHEFLPEHEDATPGPSETQPRETTPMYDARSLTPPGTGDHQYSTGDVTQPEDATDTRVKTDSGPEHWAPRNEQYTSSFDEFAGVMARDESTVLADRGGEYQQYRQAFDFGHRMANESRFTRCDWVKVEQELRRDWEKRHSDVAWDRVSTPVQQGWEAARGMG